MSDDKTIILRRGGEDRFFYDRHGGSTIDKLLLCGPDSLFGDLASLRYRPTARPFFEAWMSGVVFVDADTREVWFWSGQYPARSGLEHRLVLRLLAAAWEGWRLRWLHRPAEQLARLLPDTPPDLARLTMRPKTLAEFAALQDAPWLEALADSDLTAHIEECGAATVRGWMELSTHQAAACIVTSDGVHETAFDDGWDSTALLSAGPAAVAVLRARPHQPHEAFFTEDSIRSACWIDLASRTLSLWHGGPQWSGGVIGGGWESWEIAALEGGPQELMCRLGRSPRVLLSDGVAERLRKVAARVLPSGEHPGWRQLEAILEEAAFQPVEDL